jgi:hypothetical protein
MSDDVPEYPPSRLLVAICVWIVGRLTGADGVRREHGRDPGGIARIAGIGHALCETPEVRFDVDQHGLAVLADALDSLRIDADQIAVEQVGLEPPRLAQGRVGSPRAFPAASAAAASA